MDLFGFCVDSVWFCIDLPSVCFNEKDELIDTRTPVTGIQIDCAAKLLGLTLPATKKALNKNADNWELVFDNSQLAVRESCFKALAINAMSEGSTHAEQLVDLFASEGVFGLFLASRWGRSISVSHLLVDIPQSGYKTFDSSSRKPKSLTEKKIQATLSKKLMGRREVSTPVGDIDILTSAELIEVKNCKNWKAALRQVLAYGCYYPGLQKRIHLFGRLTNLDKKREIEETCRHFFVEVTYEHHY